MVAGAALAVAEFLLCGFADAAIGPGTALAVAVQAPAASHVPRVPRLRALLDARTRALANRC